MDWIHVADDAVKIGLGALVSWLATYTTMKQTRANEIRKILHARKLDSLESVSEKAEEHFDAWRNLASRLGGIYSGRNPPDPYFSKQQWEGILAKDKRLLETRVELGKAIAHLRLLSASDAVDSLKEYVQLVASFRDEMILQHQTPAEGDFRNTRKKVNKLISKFHRAMSDIYLDTNS